jgi:ubiquinone/menaquinone biosynthesis C-methylase UbiE
LSLFSGTRSEWVADHNQRVYQRHSYKSEARDLTAAEAAIFLRYANWIDGKAILDLGVGAGRITAFLLPRAGSYTGLDYSLRAVAACRARFPEADIQYGDARDLSRFREESFDFILFACNGIDAVAHNDRLQILREMRRVLHPGGLLAFSSHDLDAVRQDTLRKQVFRSSLLKRPRQLLNPVRLATAATRLMRRLYNRSRMRGKQVPGAGYALLNDSGMEFACMHYYITPQVQHRQLRMMGFAGPIDTCDDGGNSRYYVVRKSSC